MKKIYLILTLMVVLFAAAFIVYDYNLASEEAVILETNSTAEIDPSTPVVSVQIAESTASSQSKVVDEEDEDNDEEKNVDASHAASETLSEEEATWQGPDSRYMNADGDLLDLSDNYGKGSLINIWASWCEPCRVEMPYFEEAYQTYGDDINFIMMNALDSKPSETQAAAEAFFAEMNLSMPIYFDHEMKNQYLFGATILPLTVILDEEGKVVEIVRGQVSPAKLKQLIEKIL